MGVCGSPKAAGGGVRVPLRRDGRFANRPYDGERGIRRGFGWGCAAPRPSGYRLSPVRRWGGAGRRGLFVVGGPLRQAQGERCREARVRWGTETPRAAPLWIPAFAGMTRVGECGVAGAVGGGSPLRVPSGQASTGSGRTVSGSARAMGSGGRDGGRRRPAPRPCPGFPLSREGRSWGVCGVAGAVGGGGVRVPLRRDGRFANRPYDGEWGVRRGTETPRAAPLRVPAFAGMTLVGESGKDDGGCGGRRGLLVAVGRGSRCGGTGGSRTAPTTGSGGRDGGLGGGAPRRAPLGTGFRRYDDGGVRCGGGGVGWGRDFRLDGAGLLGIGCGVIVGWFALTLLSRATRLGQSSNLPRP